MPFETCRAWHLRRLRKLESNGFLEVEDELLRAISLRKSLRLAGKVWFRSNRFDLWSAAISVKEFDVFLSHTWLTKGRWKILSLVFQSGLLCTFVCWLFAVCLAIALCMFDILPMPFVRTADGPGGFTEECPTGPWVLTFGLFASIVGLCVSPYFCGKAEMCSLAVL